MRLTNGEPHLLQSFIVVETSIRYDIVVAHHAYAHHPELPPNCGTKHAGASSLYGQGRSGII